MPEVTCPIGNTQAACDMAGTAMLESEHEINLHGAPYDLLVLMTDVIRAYAFAQSRQGLAVH